ncbi:hypothetical protein Rhe02_54570 [Rhizocola hellebori]|uniref:Uncharacterized protein n=1 Tax=Rhizocola hellebori TaxID=1392758 RepID=A0A8J3VIA0_9ACTN|nr:hypothetical protein [Rhizocola hellebori]GIH07390.1 hypothetical protein Rhe02_54570 [Rhizocola hellebori]
MATKLSTHVFQWDGITDPLALKPVEYCTCKLPRRHPRHDVAPQTPEQDAADAARLGEHDEMEH